jgi:hypothetical protein
MGKQQHLSFEPGKHTHTHTITKSSRSMSAKCIYYIYFWRSHGVGLYPSRQGLMKLSLSGVRLNGSSAD